MRPVRGWKDLLFAGAVLFFLGLFVTFALVLIVADALYVDSAAIVTVLKADFIRAALFRSLWTSFAATGVALIFAVPVGYALSRYRFPGHILADTLVDVPIVFPPLVAGLTLLIFFNQTEFGRWIESTEGLGLKFAFEPLGIVLCQFVVSASFAIRSAKTAFDEVDRRLENVALTLGCTQWGSFLRVTLPLARGGIVSGGILTWARAFGIFGPLLIFVGTFERNQVLPTTIFLEQSVGHLEVAIAVALLMIVVAVFALIVIRLVGGRSLVKL